MPIQTIKGDNPFATQVALPCTAIWAWAYHVSVVSYYQHEIIRLELFLNERGQEGWELVHMDCLKPYEFTDDSKFTYILTFKRRG